MSRLKFSLLVIFICGCGTQQSDIIDVKLADCYKSRFYDKNDKLSDPFPYYEEFENVLIKKGYLTGTTKRDYENLWSRIEEESGVFDIEEFVVKIEPQGFASPVNVVRPKYCSFDLVGEQNIDDREIVEMFGYIERIYEKGDLGDKELNTRLIQCISAERWRQMAYRIPTLTFLYAEIVSRK